MAVQKSKYKLERSEYHQVEVTYSLEISINDQELWTRLVDFAIENGAVDEEDFPAKPSKRIEDWQLLFMHAGDQVKEIAEHFPDRWLSQEDGTVKLTISALDQSDRKVCDSIVVS